MKSAIAAIFITVLLCLAVPMAAHARKRAAEKEEKERRHGELLEKLDRDRDSNAARLYEWERKWDMVVTAGFGFSTWLSHSDAVPLTDPGFSWNAGLRSRPLERL